MRGSGRSMRETSIPVMAALGLVSGAASAILGTAGDLKPLQPIANIFFLHASLLPVGLCFATAMAVASWLFARQLSAAAIVFISALYGWSGAVHIAIRLQRHVGDDAHLIAASLVAGAFGAGVVHVGFAASVRRLWAFTPLLFTCGAGAAAGLLFYLGERGFLDRRLLFVLWQPAVATAIGAGARSSLKD